MKTIITITETPFNNVIDGFFEERLSVKEISVKYKMKTEDIENIIRVFTKFAVSMTGDKENSAKD